MLKKTQTNKKKGKKKETNKKPTAVLCNFKNNFKKYEQD